MNDRLKPSGSNDRAHAPRECGRAEDLLAYLYDEASPAESRGFAEHLNACAVCRDELAAFGGVREGINAWRSTIASAVPGIDFVPEPAEHRSASAPRRSALAALRQFFTLSPSWLRAAGVAAALAVFALAGLTVARTDVRWNDEGFALRMGVKETRVEVPVPGTFTEQQADEIAAAKVKAALDEQERVFKEREERLLVEAKAPQERQRPVPVLISADRQPRRDPPSNKVKRGDRRDNLLGEPDDEEVPGLYDLLHEAN